jgi:hypothetical protein
LRDVTRQTKQAAELIFVSLVHLSENDPTKRIADGVIDTQWLHHHACNSKAFWEKVQCMKGELIEVGRNCMKNFMICTALNWH